MHTKSAKGKIAKRSMVMGGFVAVHGLMHAVLLAAPRPDGGAGNFITRAGESAVLNALGLHGATVELIGAALVIAATMGLILAGLGLMGWPSRPAWRMMAAPAAAISTATLLMFWNDWMVAGLAIDLIIIAASLRTSGTGRPAAARGW